MNLGLPAPPTSARTKRTHPKQDHQTLLPHPTKPPYGTGTGAPARREETERRYLGAEAAYKNPELDAAPPRGGGGEEAGWWRAGGGRPAAACSSPPPCAALRTRQNRRRGGCCAVLCCRAFVRGEGGGGENPIRYLFGGVGSHGTRGLMADQPEGSLGYSQRIFLGCVDERHGQTGWIRVYWSTLLWLGWTVGRWFETARAAVGRRYMGL